MLRRTLHVSSLAVVILGLAACAGPTQSPLSHAPDSVPNDIPGTPFSAPSFPGAGSATLGQALLRGDLAQSALAIYTLDIDPVSLTATAQLKANRAAQANDDLYLLSIDSFLRPDSFRIHQLGSTATTLEVTWDLAHPFPAPSDPAGPPNGFGNRADLGITGQLVYLQDVASASGNTFFTNVIANTALVGNADGYLTPAALVDLTGLTANTFPYQTIVDEGGSTGSRIGVSNSGVPSGNFGADGWTRAEFGAGNAGWTGFGVLHQGQTSRRTLSLNRAAVAANGGFSLDIAVLAKYNDPRGGANATEKKANRLPPAAADATKFAYRMPHGALDVEKVEFVSESLGFFTNEISASTLVFRVTDWDARGIATSAADLSAESDVTKVAVGEPGLPTLAVCIPGVLGDAASSNDWDPTLTVLDDDSGMGGDVGIDTGQPGDGLVFSKAVTKLVTSGQTDGLYTGLVRVSDMEMAMPVPLATTLDATTLLPVSANLPQPVSYQSFTVSQTTPNSPPSATVQGPLTNVASGTGVLTIQVTAYNDPDANPVSIQFDWNDDGDYADAGEGLQVLAGATPSFNAPGFYSNPGLATDARQVPYQYTDGIILLPLTGTIDWTLGANQPPLVNSGSLNLANNSLAEPATFTLANSALSVTDPEGDPMTYTVRAVPTSGTTQTASGIALGTLNGYNASPVMGSWNAANSTIAFTVFANDALHPVLTGTTVPNSPLVGTVIVGGCGLSMSAVDCTLATLTTGSVLRSGTAVQPITGIRVGWSDIAGEAQYAIQRGTWAASTNIGSVSWSTIGTAAANAASYDDTTINASGTRYLYRVMPRCTIGGPDIATPSQMAMVALQDFESASLGTLNNSLPPTALSNDWILNCATANVNPTVPYSQVAIVDSAGGAISGTRGLYIAEVHESSPSNTQGWETFSPPGLNDRANFPSIGTSRLELNHAGNDFSGTSGYTFLSNDSRPTNGLPLPAGPNTWRWVAGPSLTGRTYNDNNASSFTTNCFPSITTASGGSVVSGTTLFHFGDLGAGSAPMHLPGYSAFDATPSTFGTTNHDFIFMCSATADNSRVEGVRYDDIAWIVY